MKHKLLSGLLVGAFFIGLLVPSLVAAQNNSAETGNGFRISPVRVEMVIDKGKSDTVKLTIENPTPADIQADIIVNDFEAATDESGQPKVIFDSDKSAPGNSFRSLVGDLGSINIPAKGKKDITVTVSVPSNASSGGYYGAIRVVPVGGADKNVTLAASVGTIFLVRVPGQITESLNLVEFTAAKNGSTGRFFINSGQMQVVTRLQNTGNIHVKPYGTVQITDRSGNVVEQYEFNNTDPRANVLPSSTRKFTDNLKNENWFGKYTVTANLGYGEGGSLITAKNTFWVIPSWMLIVALVILAALFIAGFMVYRKFSTRRHRSVRARR